MPDISMCPSDDCPLRAKCYRSEASGTKPSGGRQSWINWRWYIAQGDGVLCDGFWPARPAQSRVKAAEEGA